jgi:hypothetical protein
MNKNEVFRNFLKNPLIKDYLDYSDKQLQAMNLQSNSPNRLIDVIKTTIINLEDEETVDLVARKINQSFKRNLI